MQNKIHLVYSKQKPEWVSCQSIQSNLLTAYSKVEDRLSESLYSEESTAAAAQVIKDLRKIRPQKIVFIDHQPHPLPIFKLLSENKDLVKVAPEIIIHVYGDFTLHLEKWRLCEKALKNWRVTWVAASEAQEKLLRHFIKNKNSVARCPFPVNTDLYRFKKETPSLRKKLGLAADAKVILYTGRLSRQKQILPLLSVFSKISQKQEVKRGPWLLLAGSFDDLGIPYLDKPDALNQYFSDFILKKESLPSEVQDRILYLGNLNQKELLEAYSLADIFISLSLHNDEDFGMSPAEALCMGLPAVLTGWGGYSSFPLYSSVTRLISTQLTPNGPCFSEKDALQALHSLLGQTLTTEQRFKNSQEAIAALSPKGVAHVLQSILKNSSSVFAGFEPLIHQPQKTFNKEPLFYETKKIFTDDYARLYESYIHGKK